MLLVCCYSGAIRVPQQGCRAHLLDPPDVMPVHHLVYRLYGSYTSDPPDVMPLHHQVYRLHGSYTSDTPDVMPVHQQADQYLMGCWCVASVLLVCC